MKFYSLVLIASVSLFSASALAEDQVGDHVKNFVEGINVDHIATQVKEGQAEFAHKAGKIAQLVAERAKAHSEDFEKWQEKAQPVFEEAGRHIASVSAQAPATIKQIEAEIRSSSGGSSVTD